jgi:hypothetical protein
LPIKIVPMNPFPYSPNEKNDCIALRMVGKDANSIEMSFPFHEDTPNFSLTIPEAMDLKNAIDQLLDIKLLEKPRGNE